VYSSPRSARCVWVRRWPGSARTHEPAGRWVQLLGRLTCVEGHRARFADDLAESVALGDARNADIRAALRELDLDGVGAVICTTGFRPDYTRWVRFPVLDAMGFPLTHDDATTVVPASSSAGSTSIAASKARADHLGETTMAPHQPAHRREGSHTGTDDGRI